MTEISVIIPTYNRVHQLKQVVTALEQQTYPLQNFEVIIVSDGSTDGTHEYVEKVATPLTLRLIQQQNQGAAGARNRGVAHANGKLILFIDDDVVPGTSLIEEHWLTHMKHNDDVVVLGPMLTPADFDMQPWVRWEQAMLAKQYESMIIGRWQPTARQFYTGNTSLKRRHIIDAGGFDPSFRRAEDVELAFRLADRGLRFIFNAKAIGYHYALRSFNSWMAIPYAYGRNDVIFWRNKGQSWLVPTIWREFHNRHLLIRKLTHLCLDRPFLTKTALFTLKSASQISNWLEIAPLSRMAYSGIFNLRHYQGVSDELGGRKRFFKGVARAADHQYDSAEISSKKNDSQYIHKALKQ